MGQRKASLGDQVYLSLRKKITRGIVPPGTRLVEDELADEFSVSRTPIREALRRLEQEKLVKREPGAGLTVPELSAIDTAEIIGIRSVLEGYAARLAASRIDEAELAALVDLHAKTKEATLAENRDRLVNLNTAFHDSITKASHSRRCIEMVQQLRDFVLAYRIRILSTREARVRSLEEHNAILCALQDRNPEQAEHLVRDHVSGLVDQLVSDAIPR